MSIRISLTIYLVLQTYENEGRYYECDLLPFMELGNVAHKYYLLNIRLPVSERKKINMGIGEIKDIRLAVSILYRTSLPDRPVSSRLGETNISLIIKYSLLCSLHTAEV